MEYVLTLMVPSRVNVPMACLVMLASTSTAIAHVHRRQSVWNWKDRRPNVSILLAVVC